MTRWEQEESRSQAEMFWGWSEEMETMKNSVARDKGKSAHVLNSRQSNSQLISRSSKLQNWSDSGSTSCTFILSLEVTVVHPDPQEALLFCSSCWLALSDLSNPVRHWSTSLPRQEEMDIVSGVLGRGLVSDSMFTYWHCLIWSALKCPVSFEYTLPTVEQELVCYQ